MKGERIGEGARAEGVAGIVWTYREREEGVQVRAQAVLHLARVAKEVDGLPRHRHPETDHLLQDSHRGALRVDFEDRGLSAESVYRDHAAFELLQSHGSSDRLVQGERRSLYMHTAVDRLDVHGSGLLFVREGRNVGGCGACRMPAEVWPV